MHDADEPLDGADQHDTVILSARPKGRLQARVQQVGPIWVEVVGGPMDGLRRHVVGNTLTVGRSEDNTLVLGMDPMVSGNHARIVRDDEKTYLEDLSSRNGTFVGDRKVGARTPIQPGTIFSVGTTSLEFMPR